MGGTKLILISMTNEQTLVEHRQDWGRGQTQTGRGVWLKIKYVSLNLVKT